MLNFLTTTTVCGFSLYHVLAFFLIYSCTGCVWRSSLPLPPPVSW